MANWTAGTLGRSRLKNHWPLHGGSYGEKKRNKQKQNGESKQSKKISKIFFLCVKSYQAMEASIKEQVDDNGEQGLTDNNRVDIAATTV